MSDKNTGNTLGRERSVKCHYISRLTKHVLRVLLPVAAAGLFSVSAAQADYNYSGNINPSTNPDTWTSSTSAYIGDGGNGSVTVSGGSSLLTKALEIGYTTGSTGTLTLTGTGTTYTKTSGGTFIGAYDTGAGGTGYLNVLNQATANLNYFEVGSTAATGIVTINNATVNVTDAGTGYFTVGNTSNSNGNSTGYVYVTNGGQLNNNETIASGGSTANGNIADGTNSYGAVTVDGAKSQWTNTGVLYVGAVSTGTGKLSISDGGLVTATSASLNTLSTLTTDVGSKLTLGGGSGALTNSGTIRLVAGAGAANGTYTPISAGTWSGTGTIQALGGEWNSTNHTVTVNSAITTAAGNSATMDLYTNQRGIVTNPATGQSVGLGFQAASAPGTNLVTFTANTIGGNELSSLQSLVGVGNSVLSAWSFTGTTGYTTGSPVYLSLSAGAGQSLASLAVWDYNGSAWSQLSPADLAYDGNYASFTALNLNDIAVSGTETATPTPVPAAIWLFGSGLMGLIGIRRKNVPAIC